MARSRACGLTWVRWYCLGKERGGEDLGKPWTFERKCCLKSKILHTLWGKSCVCCISTACLATVLNTVSTWRLWPPTQMKKTKIIKTDEPAVGLGVLLSSSWMLPADALQWGQNLCSVFPPTLMQSLHGKCSYKFHWSEPITMLPVRTNGEQTTQNNSSCFFSYKFTHIWCMQQSEMMCFMI